MTGDTTTKLGGLLLTGKTLSNRYRTRPLPRTHSPIVLAARGDSLETVQLRGRSVHGLNSTCAPAEPARKPSVSNVRRFMSLSYEIRNTIGFGLCPGGIVTKKIRPVFGTGMPLCVKT